MRPVRLCAILAALVSAAPAAPLTIVLDFDGPRSTPSIDAMKREVESLLKTPFDWRLRAELDAAPIENLVVVRFKGKCVMQPVGYLYDERGPLAFTYSTAGVQPYSEAACDKVIAAVRSAIAGGRFRAHRILLGRALGRIVAHEMAHILTKSES